MITLFFYIYSGAFETLTPAGGLSNCQDVLCAVAYAADCTSFLYNRLDDSCIVFDRKIEPSKCDVHGAPVIDNPDELDCEDPADKCQVSRYLVTYVLSSFKVFIYFFSTIFCRLSLNLSANILEPY